MLKRQILKLKKNSLEFFTHVAYLHNRPRGVLSCVFAVPGSQKGYVYIVTTWDSSDKVVDNEHFCLRRTTFAAASLFVCAGLFRSSLQS